MDDFCLVRVDTLMVTRIVQFVVSRNPVNDASAVVTVTVEGNSGIGSRRRLDPVLVLLPVLDLGTVSLTLTLLLASCP